MKQHERCQNSQETNGAPVSWLFETLVKATDLRGVSRPARPSQKASKVRRGRPGGMWWFLWTLCGSDGANVDCFYLFLGWVKQLLQCFLGSRWLSCSMSKHSEQYSDIPLLWALATLVTSSEYLSFNKKCGPTNMKGQFFMPFWIFTSALGQSPTFNHLSRWRPDPVQQGPSPAKSRRHKMRYHLNRVKHLHICSIHWGRPSFLALFTPFEANSAIICGQQVCRIIQNSRLLRLQVRLDQFFSSNRDGLDGNWCGLSHTLVLHRACWMPPWQRYRCLLWMLSSRLLC